MNFIQLKSLAKKSSTNINPDMRIAVMGDTATQFLVTAIKGCAYSCDINAEIYEAEYNQIFTEIIDDNSGLYKFNPDYIVIYMDSLTLYDEFCNTPLDARTQFAEIIANKINSQWITIANKTNSRIIQYNFAEYNDMTFGGFGSKTQSSYIFQLRKLNFMLAELASNNQNVYIADLASVQNVIGRPKFFSEKYYYSAKMAISVEAIPMAAEIVVDIICALKGKFKKCVVLDLDNTLWGGVIGDDGINNIQIGELGTGRAFSDFQKWLKELKNRGIILAVCSKNNEDIAKEPFEKHPEMILKLDDIAMFVANWNDKATNIRHIQQTLNIGMDSMVFIDDNPFERNLVRELIPEITTPELPEDPAQYLSYLQQLNLFETASYSGEDAKRTAQYQAETKRIELQNNYSSIADYLKSLEMIGEAKAFDEFHVPRISQLTQRSNQFNLRTKRYTEAEIAEISHSDNFITLYFTLKDKFGEHGLISVVILEKRENYLFIDTWLMSCRVLKRTVEEYIINKIINTATCNGYSKVVGEYIATPKNAMVKDIYETLGFTRISENTFECDVNTYCNKINYISEEE